MDRIRALQHNLMIHKIKWVEEENLHITLKFFGETPEEKIPEISNILHSVASSSPAFTFRFEGLGIFGSSYNPKVIWAAVKPYEDLSFFIQLLKKGLVVAGFPEDRQNPVPHLTLGRVRTIKDARHFQKVLESNRTISSQPMSADTLILFESILRQSGPEYYVTESYSLKK